MQARKTFRHCYSFLAFTVATASATAQVLYVDDTATGANNGSSWCNAYVRLRDALSAASSPFITEIRVAQGTYRPDRTASTPGGSGQRSATFSLRNGLAIRGGYAGCGAPDPDARNVTLYPSVLSGDLLGNDQLITTAGECSAAGGVWYGSLCSVVVNNGENSYHVVSSLGNDATAVLDGLRVYGGNSSADGGGVYNTNGAHPTLINCRIEQNRAVGRGGGMFNGFGTGPRTVGVTFEKNYADGLGGGGVFNDFFSEAAFHDCSFLANAARQNGGGTFNTQVASATFAEGTRFVGNVAQDGGGVFNSDSDAVFTDCTFTGNSAAGEYADGGAIYTNAQAAPRIERCVFDSNTASVNGGAIRSLDSSPFIKDSTFTNNYAGGTPNLGADGGALSFLNASTPTVTNCMFLSNSVAVNGGAIYAWQNVVLTVDRCRFLGNSAESGGGLWINSAHAVVSNSVFSGNRGHAGYGFGGGIHLGATQSVVTNCTFYANSAFNGGGALGYSTGRLTNNIFWQNWDARGTQDAGGQIVGNMIVNRCCVQGWSGVLGGTGNIGSNPLFLNAAGPDGVAGTLDDNLRVSSGSPVHNQGDNAAVIGAYDLDGNNRITNGTVDLGAYEVAAACGNGVCVPPETRCTCPADCGQPPLAETACTDGLDNDCDGKTDCVDPQCPPCPCGQPGDPPCSNGTFCKFPTGSCGTDGTAGTCTSNTGMCTEDVDPVCGCGDVTYPNACYADLAAVSIRFLGPCELPECAATRVLSDPDPTFCPGASKHVRILLDSSLPATAIAVEDTPPADWMVSNISDGGSYDAINGKVKWGPFFAPFPAQLSYDVLPSNDAGGPKCFAGVISKDGSTQAICGEHCLDVCCPGIAAETPSPCAACAVADCSQCSEGACGDGQVSLCEAISYACAWQRGCNDEIANVTQAAFLWRGGECYCWDHATQGWHSTSCENADSTTCCDPGAVAAATTDSPDGGLAQGRFTRLSASRGTRSAWLVEVDVPAGTAVAAEVVVPEDWEIQSVDSGGTLDATHGKVKWGPFLDGAARTVSVELRPIASRTAAKLRGRVDLGVQQALTGRVSIDGIIAPIDFGD